MDTNKYDMLNCVEVCSLTKERICTQLQQIDILSCRKWKEGIVIGKMKAFGGGCCV